MYACTSSWWGQPAAFVASNNGNLVLQLHLTGEVDKSVRFSCQILSGFNVAKNYYKLVNFWSSYSKIKRWTFFGTECTFAHAICLSQQAANAKANDVKFKPVKDYVLMFLITSTNILTCTPVVRWLRRWTCDSEGRGFDSRPRAFRWQPWASCSHTRATVNKQ